MDGGTPQHKLDLGHDEDIAEQQAKKLFERLQKMHQLRRDGLLKRNVASNYRQRLIEGMAELGYIDFAYHVERFMRLAGLEVDEQNEAQALASWKLMERKQREFEQAFFLELPEGELNAGIDLIWTVMAVLISQGHDVRGAFREVARANEDKVPPEGPVPFTADGRVDKPEGWKPPQLAEFVGY